MKMKAVDHKQFERSLAGSAGKRTASFVGVGSKKQGRRSTRAISPSGTLHRPYQRCNIYYKDIDVGDLIYINTTYKSYGV